MFEVTVLKSVNTVFMRWIWACWLRTIGIEDYY